MAIKREIDPAEPGLKRAAASPSPAGRKIAARNPARPPPRPPGAALPLDDAARERFLAADGLTVDVDGHECLRGLTRAESFEYLSLDRVGLDNDDAAFLRYILLGDRHAAAVSFSS